MTSSRSPHNHIAQCGRGVEGCPACQAIDRTHMLEDYAELSWLRLKSERKWERALRE
jgi:hypothetical protein